jgi:heterodisulfide reductase subunit A
LTIKKKYPDARVYYLYRDIRSFGKGHEEYYKKACESGLLLLKYKPEAPPVVSRDQKGLVVTVEDVLTNNETIAIPANLVVLNVGMIPRKDASDIQTKLRISKGADGFFQEAHAKLRPIDTPLDGIYLAGTTQGPKDITESTTMGSAAAAKASIPLARGKVEVEPTVASVNEDICKGCARCEEVCEYGAIKVEETGPFDRVPMLVAKVTEAQCKGCGSCSVVCPTGAITMRHFTKEQIKAMVAAATGG